mgnify:CR=1 FL=1|tara:strand:+ start:65 stop:385 length:321 start_codon:yes stop_codon:yes gene_type:complete
MIINLTDAEALALSQRLRAKTTPVEDPIEEGEGVLAEINAQALESVTGKLRAAMEKSDAKLARRLDYAISSLEVSGFDTVELEALKGARDKAALHNDSKYESKKLK